MRKNNEKKTKMHIGIELTDTDIDKLNIATEKIQNERGGRHVSKSDVVRTCIYRLANTNTDE